MLHRPTCISAKKIQSCFKRKWIDISGAAWVNKLLQRFNLSELMKHLWMKFYTEHTLSPQTQNQRHFIQGVAIYTMGWHSDQMPVKTVRLNDSERHIRNELCTLSVWPNPSFWDFRLLSCSVWGRRPNRNPCKTTGVSDVVTETKA